MEANSCHERSSDSQLLGNRHEPEASFASFYRRHVTDVTRFARARDLDAHAAADVVANTFLAALRARYRYREENPTALPWLLTIASRNLARSHRSRRRQDRLTRKITTIGLRDLSEADTTAYDEMEPESERLQAALDALAPALRAAVTRRVVDGADYPTLAREANVTEAAARQRVSRGLRSLHTQIAPAAEEHHDA